MNERNDIQQRIAKILSEKMAFEIASPETDIYNAGFTSILAASLITHLEAEFNVRIDRDRVKVDHIRSIAKITDFITELRAKQQGA